MSAGTPAAASWLTPRRVMLIFAAAVALIAIASRLAWPRARGEANRHQASYAGGDGDRGGAERAPTTVSIIGTIGARYDTPDRRGRRRGPRGGGVRGSRRSRQARTGARAHRYVGAGTASRQSAGGARAGPGRSRPRRRRISPRAVAVGKSGALSAEETERRRSSSVTAAAKVKVAAAQLAEAQARLARAEVRAPADGIILTRTVEVGQTVSRRRRRPCSAWPRATKWSCAARSPRQDLPLLESGPGGERAPDRQLTRSIRAGCACSVPSSIRKPAWEWCGSRSRRIRTCVPALSRAPR